MSIGREAQDIPLREDPHDLRLAIPRLTHESDLPRALCELLARTTDSEDFDSLRARLDQAQSLVRSAYDELVAAHAAQPDTETDG